MNIEEIWSQMSSMKVLVTTDYYNYYSINFLSKEKKVDMRHLKIGLSWTNNSSIIFRESTPGTLVKKEQTSKLPNMSISCTIRLEIK